MQPTQEKLRNEILKVKDSDYLFGIANYHDLDLECLNELIENIYSIYATFVANTVFPTNSQ